MSKWTILELTMAVLLTSLTGGILTLVWQGIGRGMERAGFTNITFELLKAVVIFYFLPLSFFFLKKNKQEIGKGYLFSITPAYAWISQIFLAVWTVGMILFFLGVFCRWLMLRRREQDLIPCDKDIVSQFRKIYQKLGGKGERLALYQSYRFEVPCVTGIFRPRVILPMRKYTTEELQVIFTHEITHYRQKDLLLKWVSLIMVGIHFFNPLAWMLYRNVRRWSEYACDFRACDKAGGLKNYFGVIAEIAVCDSGDVMASQLTEDKNELEERIKRMVKNRKAKHCRRWAAVLLSGVAFIVSSVSVYGATLASAKGYVYLYHLTEVAIEVEPMEPVFYEEFEETGYAEGITVKTGEVILLNRAFPEISNWSVGSGESMETEGFYCNKGESVVVMMDILPEDVEVKIGLIDANSDKKYIMAKGKSIYHEFSVSATGTYKVFVENQSKTSVTVNGVYRVH